MQSLHPPFSCFFLNHSLFIYLAIPPNEIWDKHENKLMRQNYFFKVRKLQKLQNNVTWSFYKQTFLSNTRLRFDLK